MTVRTVKLHSSPAGSNPDTLSHSPAAAAFSTARHGEPHDPTQSIDSTCSPVLDDSALYTSALAAPFKIAKMPTVARSAAATTPSCRCAHSVSLYKFDIRGLGGTESCATRQYQNQLQPRTRMAGHDAPFPPLDSAAPSGRVTRHRRLRAAVLDVESVLRRTPLLARVRPRRRGGFDP